MRSVRRMQNFSTDILIALLYRGPWL